MTNQEIKSYERMGIPVAKKKRKVRDFSIYELLEYGFLFLLSKIYLFGALSPLGLSYFAAVFPKQKRSMGVVAACLGIAAAGMGVVSLKYVGALVISSAFFTLMEKEFSSHKWLYPVAASVSLVLTGMIFVIFDGFLLYDFLCQVLESVLVFLLYFAFDKTTELMRGFQGRRVFDPVESLSLLVLCGGVIMSLETIPYFAGAAHILSLVIIFVAGLTGGFSLSCSAGVMLGLVNSLTDVLPAQVVAVYGLSALCSGLLQNKGRWGVILGFFAANSLAALYFSASANRVIAFYYVLSAGAVLFLIPDRFLSLFGEVMKAPGYQEDSVQRVREIIQDKLTEISVSFADLSHVFHDAVENRVDAEIRDPGYLFDRTADQICSGCSLMNYCWQKEYNETRHALLTLYGRMEQRGRAEAEDVPEGFKNACIRLENFLEVLNKNYEIHKINLLWAGRVSESRNLVAEQFKNVSSVLEHLKHELGSEPTDGIRLERKIAAALDREGIETSHVRVSGCDGLEVTLTMENCGEEKQCFKEAAAVIGKAVGVPMLQVGVPYGENSCRLRFREQSQYTVESGFACVAGNNGIRSGDRHMLSHSADGRYILALSDGMGQGDRAEAQSSMTVHLIRRLLAAGFDKETALRLINSMLMVSGEQESFATADLCLVNLYSGGLEFIKIGAASSYVKRNGEVEKISCTSLPAGVVCEVEADCDLKYAQEGDFVVMVTDGVTDVLENSRNNRLAAIIEEYQGDAPQGLADAILQAAVRESGGMPKDDMTVLAARITRA